MSEEEVKPLFWPGESIRENSGFICNINGEVSLWRIGKGFGNMRVYTEDYKGTWLNELENHEVYLASLLVLPNMRERAEILRRNIDAILVYGAMLGEKHSGVG